jgi:hypothetical protein
MNQYDCVQDSAAIVGGTGRRARGTAHLGEIFADGLGGGAEIVAEGAGIARLAGALPEEFAGNMRRVWFKAQGPGLTNQAQS